MDKIYVGIGRTKDTDYGKQLSISFSESDIDKLKNNLKKGWITMFVGKRKEADGDKTHYGYILEGEQSKPKDETTEEDDSLPF